MVCSSLANAIDGDRPSKSETVALLPFISPSSSSASAEPPEAKKFCGFFGYLEFDFDPDAPGGVPGFGEISDPARRILQAHGN
jgi:hypothetical protein